MDNRSKSPRHIGKPKNYQLVDFGACKDWQCPNNEYRAGKLLEHFHGLMYKDGFLDDDETEQMKFLLNQLGYVGELVVEYVSHDGLQRILNKRFHEQKAQEKALKKSLLHEQFLKENSL